MWVSVEVREGTQAPMTGVTGGRASVWRLGTELESSVREVRVLDC